MKENETVNIVTVREMVQTDVTAVAQIEKEAFSMPWSEQGFADALKQENTIFLVAEYEGHIAGYCGLYYAADEGEITNVAVKESLRRRKIADGIISEIIKAARQKKIAAIYLEVRESNLPARKLYEKHGFVPQGIRKNFYRNPREHAVVMICQPEVSTVESGSERLQ